MGREEEKKKGEERGGEEEVEENETIFRQMDKWVDRQTDRQMSLPMSWQDLKLQVPEAPMML